MPLEEIFEDKELKPSQRSGKLRDMLVNKEINAGAVVSFAASSKDPAKATCLEALELATKKNPALATKECFDFAVESLASDAPRVKWESARLIGNTAHLFGQKLEKAIARLLENSNHEGTVVRWSTAYALGEILKLGTKHSKDLRSAIESILQREKKESIRKIYLGAAKLSG